MLQPVVIIIKELPPKPKVVYKVVKNDDGFLDFLIKEIQRIDKCITK